MSVNNQSQRQKTVLTVMAPTARRTVSASTLTNAVLTMESATVGPAIQARLVTRLAKMDSTASTVRKNVCVRMAAHAIGRPANVIVHLVTLDNCKTSRKRAVTFMASLAAAFKAAPTACTALIANTRADARTAPSAIQPMVPASAGQDTKAHYARKNVKMVGGATTVLVAAIA